MIRYSLIIIFFVFLSEVTAQSFILHSVAKTITNENNDPLINKTDPDGLRQGDWLYKDVNNEIIAKEIYSDGAISDVFYSIDGFWHNSNTWEKDFQILGQLKQQLSSILESHEISLSLQEQQQMVFFIDSNGQLMRFALLGYWDIKYAQDITSSIHQIFQHIHIQNVIHETCILY